MPHTFSRLSASRLSSFGLALAIVALASSSSQALILPILSQGGTYVWKSGSSGSGNWNTSTNWTVTGGTNPGPVPDASATVYILDGNQPSETVTYNYTGTAVTLSGLFIGDGTNTGTPGIATNTLSIGAGTLSSSIEDVGDGAGFSYGQGAILQTAGTNNGGTGLGLTLNLGYNTTDTGQYTLQGGVLNALTENIGDFGTGIFTQTSGTNTTKGLTLSTEGGSNGTYNLTGGTLTVSNNIALNGNGTTGGTFNLNAAATLSYGTFTQSGGTFSGTLTNGTNFVYNGGTFTGEFINSSTGTATLSAAFNPTAGIDNSGTINLTSSIGGAAALTNESAGNIQGYGSISTSVPFTNNGTISANTSEQTLTFDGPPSITNMGKLQATGGGTLNLDPLTINNGGTITAANGSIVDLDATILVGGTLSSTGTGYILALNDPANGNSALDGSSVQYGPVTVTAGSTVRVQAGGTLALVGAITNDGNITDTDTSSPGITLQVGNSTTPSAILSGTGTVELERNGSTISGYSTTTVDTLTNSVGHTIEGLGTIQGLSLFNNGLIQANNPANALTLQNLSSVTNTGTMQADPGPLVLSGLSINNSGTIQAVSPNGATSIVYITSSTISGGTVSTAAANSAVVLNGTFPELDGQTDGPLTLNGDIVLDTTTTLAGTIINNTNLNDSNSPDPVTGLTPPALNLKIGDGTSTTADLQTTGGGTLTMSQSGSTISGYASTNTLTNDTGHTIQGQGTIDNLNVVNKGMINSNAGGTLNLGLLTIDNAGGSISAVGGSTVSLNSTTVQGGTIGSTGAGSIQVEPSVNGSYALDGSTTAGAVTISAGSTINVSDYHAETMLATGEINNGGTIQASGIATATISSANVNNGNGTLQATGSALLNVDSSTISGGNVSAIFPPNTPACAVVLGGTFAELDGQTDGPVTLSGAIILDTTTVITGTIINNTFLTDEPYYFMNMTSPALNLVIGDGSGAPGSTSARLSGTGTVDMTKSGATISGYSRTTIDTLTNDTNHTIEGGGMIQNLALINYGTIEASGSREELTLQELSSITNTNGGVLGTETDGTLDLNGLTIQNNGGTIEGLGGYVVIDSSIVQGGTIEGAVALAGTSANPELDGSSQGSITIQAELACTASTVLITGMIYNNVRITDDVNLLPAPPLNLKIVADATLSSTGIHGGQIQMTQVGAAISGYSTGDALTNDTSEIVGQGTIQNLALTNNATIDANIAGGTLTLTGLSSVTNSGTGTLTAENGGTLDLKGLTVQNAGIIGIGNGRNGGAGSVIIDGSTIQGGLIESLATGVPVQMAGNNPELDGSTTHGSVYISADIYSTANAMLIAGTINNNGTIGDGFTNVSSEPPLNLEVVGDTTLSTMSSGRGAISMTQVGSAISGYPTTGDTLTNDTGHTIQGRGTIQNLNLINSGTIDANVAGGTLLLTTNITDNSTGILEATNGGELDITNVRVTGSGQVVVGSGSKIVVANSSVLASTLTIHGQVQGDPSTFEIGQLNLESDGSMFTTPGDNIIIDENLIDDSGPGNFQTPGTDLEFAGSGMHTLSTGNALSFQMLTLDSGATLDTTGTGSLFADEIVLPNENPADIGSELQGDLAITYDVNNPANAYLLDATYTFPGGGSLSPVTIPEPGAMAMVVMAGMLTMRRQRTSRLSDSK